MYPKFSGEHHRQPGHEERDGDDGEDGTHDNRPGGRDTGDDLVTDKYPTQERAHADKSSGQNLEGRKGVPLIAPRALDGNGGLGVESA